MTRIIHRPGHPTRRSAMRRPQEGVVLILALVLLAVISMVAIMSVRGSISTEAVAKNLRTSAVALQAAETALRYCEEQVLSGNIANGVVALTINELSLTGTETIPTLWATRANWANASIANTLSTTVANSDDTAARALPVLPQCMIERYGLPTTQGGVPRESYLITSVGYSTDYRTSGGQVISGGETWLQSILRR